MEERVLLPGGRPVNKASRVSHWEINHILWIDDNHPSIDGYYPWISMDKQGWYWVGQPGSPSGTAYDKDGPFTTLEEAATHFNLIFPEV